jgi:dihydrofolate reductase
MRRIVVTEFVALDGVVEAPERWHVPYIEDELLESVGKRYFASDALLLGRVTYHSFVGSWPFRTADDFAFADHMNAEMSKYVVSTTLDGVEWGRWDDATLIKGDVAEEVSRLKREPGKDILVAGSVSLVQALLREDLIDELHLLVHPVVAGKGRRLFEDGGDPKRFELIDSKTLGTGVLDLACGLER